MNELKAFGLNPDGVQTGGNAHDLANFKLHMAMLGDVDYWKGATHAALEDQFGLHVIWQARWDGNNAHDIAWLHA